MPAQLKPTGSQRPADRTDDAPSTTELLDLFGDEYTRRVFEAVAERPRSGREVADAADVSRPTAYRRLNDLRDAGLVATETVISGDGHHHERFEAAAEGISVSLGDGDIEAVVRLAD